VDAVLKDDESRTEFLKACLSKLGLRVSQQTCSVPPLSHLHLSALNHVDVPLLLEDLKDVITEEGGEEYIKGENDTFHIGKQDSSWPLGSLVKSLPIVNSAGSEDRSRADQHDMPMDDRIIGCNTILRLVPHESNWPGTKETPYFNHYAFFANLRKYQQENSSNAEEFGRILMYGEVVTSTNTVLEK
jgi:biotin---protein ligase